MSQPIHEARFMLETYGVGAALIEAEKREEDARNPVVSRDEWSHAYSVYAYLKGYAEGLLSGIGHQ